MPEPIVVAVLGAESTGKTSLAEALAGRAARTAGLRCSWVPETLREWCEQRGRTPLAVEQRAIADEHGERIEAAAAIHDLVVCDTTPLTTAVYSRYLFDDASLEPVAVAWHRRVQLTLLMALDLPWVADGIQRDGPHVREPVDALLRQMLLAHGLPFAVVSGTGPDRLEAAWTALAPLLPGRAEVRGLLTGLGGRPSGNSRWRCDCCDVPELEAEAYRR